MQRCPAVPTARTRPRAPPGRGRRSAPTIIALLPPSSSSGRPSRAATSGASALPIAVEPVAETSGRRGSSASCRARSAPPITTSNRPVRSVAERRAARCEERLAGERGERRALARLPHDRIAAHERERRVPAHTATGKLKARDHADGPERVPLLEHPVARALGGDREAVELARQADREVADVDHLLHLAEALRAILPVSSVTSAPSASFSLRSSSPSSRTSSPRRGAGTSRQCSKAAVGRARSRHPCPRRRCAHVREQLAGDRGAHLEIAARQGAAIEAEPVENVIDCAHGAPPSEPPAVAGRPDRAMGGLRYAEASADVAQLARASPCHGEGRGFEPLHPLSEPRGQPGSRGRAAPTSRQTPPSAIGGT